MTSDVLKIDVRGLVRRFVTKGGTWGGSAGAAGEYRRPARPERCRQKHDDADAHHPAAASADSPELDQSDSDL